MTDSAAADRPPAKLRWLGRGVIVTATVAMMLGSAMSAMVGVSRSSYPAAALRLDADDPVALARELDVALSTDGMALVRSNRIRGVAQRSIAQQAVNPVALRMLAIDAEVKKDKRANDLLLLAERLSRREFGTQTLLIEARVAKNDVTGALRHYDRILRVRPAAQSMLFPMFDSAASEPDIAKAVTLMMAKEPLWMGDFVDWTISDATTISNLASIYLRLPMRNPKIWTEERKRGLIGKFVAYERPEVAAQLYGRFAGSGKPTLVRDGQFERRPAYPPFDWQAEGGSEVSASVNEGSVTYNGASATEGVVLTQLLSLKPGQYAFGAKLQQDRVNPDAPLQWTVSCFGKNAPVPLAIDVQNDVSQRAFTIPGANCSYQWLRLKLRATEDAEGQSGTVRAVKIVPLGN